MQYGIYLSTAGLQTNQYQQEVLANNLANLNTVGFKHDLSIVRERRIESEEDLVHPSLSDPLLETMTGGSLVAPTYTTFEQGPLQTTGNPLDVAIVGEGFFAVEDGEDEVYTRDGRFTINPASELVTAAGNHRVLDQSGLPIAVPTDVQGRAHVDANGIVRVGDEPVGRLRTVVFDDPSLLRKRGANVFESLGAKASEQPVHLRTMTVEGSTVEPARSLVSMMHVARAYELNAQMISLADSTLNRVVNDLPRIR